MHDVGEGFTRTIIYVQSDPLVLQNKSRILFEEEGGISYAAQISSTNSPLYDFMWSEVCQVSMTPADTSPYVRRRQNTEGLKG